MPLFPVTPEKQRALETRMQRVGLIDGDLVETFVRGSGPGGQKINKASIAVVLTHPPSGLSVRCQASRSQALNRFLARRLLVEKLEAKILGEKTEEEMRRAKIRRQKRRRSRRAKDKMLADKRHEGQKKERRLKIRPPAPGED